MTAAEDQGVPFQLEASSLRGRIVRLDAAIDKALRLHDYPEPVARLLAEATALAAALGSSLKFDGVFTLQAKGDGPVSLLVADVTSDGAFRACARFDAARLAQAAGDASLLGQGHLVFTVDQNLGQDNRYQGIVQLEGKSLAEAFQLYFRQSEQIPTGLLAAAQRDGEGRWHAGCLMIQRLAREGGVAPRDTSEEDDWHRAMSLMQTCTPQELADPALPLEDLLFRLFHEEGVRVYDHVAFRHECRCSRERVGNLLSSLSPAERAEMVVDGHIEAKCEFCSAVYAFTESDLSKTPDPV